MNVTFKGSPVTLAGSPPGVGERAPDFTLTDGSMNAVTLDDVIKNGSRLALLICVPSLDTGVCSLESQKFNARVGELPADVTAYVVSRDLPFAQARWVKEQGDVRLQMLSDYRDHSFGRAFGIEVRELGLLARSIFIIGKDKTIAYQQVVPEIGQEPDYDDAIAAAYKSSSAVNA